MTDATLGRLASLRRTLLVVAGGRAALTGVAAALATVAALLLLARVAPDSDPGQVARLAIALLVGLVAAAVVRVRAGRITEQRVALWVEERVPGLEFALVTAADPRHRALAGALAPRLRAVPWTRLGRAAAGRALALPVLAASLAALALVVAASPRAVRDAVATLAPGRGAAGADALEGARLEVREATVRPPAYTGWPARTVRDPSSVQALVGSVVELSGIASDAPDGRVERAGADGATTPLRPSVDGGDWRVRMEMPEAPAVVHVSLGGLRRLVVLEPQVDSAPVVAFAPSVRDTVLREPRGTIALAATARDDVGLQGSGFEWIVSSGEGESYTFRNGVLGAAEHRGARSATMRASLQLDGMELAPGDVIHLRAVARDGNTRSGPGLGASETRVVRIARAGEYDSIAVEAAPPAALDTTAVSQRMLLVRTERLEAGRPRMQRQAVLDSSRAISVLQGRLRRQVGEMVYMRLGEATGGEHSHFAGDGHEHGQETKLDPEQLLARASAATDIQTDALDFHGDETPVVAVNRPLLEAYNHMWDATRALDLGEPDEAIPPMRLALEAIQKARAAERIYLRGRPPAVVVDVASARLARPDSGADGRRLPREAVDAVRAARLRRLDAALLVARRDAAAAADSLQLLRVELLRDDPGAATALGEAVELLRASRDAAAPLARARRLLGGSGQAGSGLPRWGGMR